MSNKIAFSHLVFEPIEKKHLSDVIDIEQDSFTKPWPLKSFEQIIEKRNYAGFVLFYKDRVVGYSVFYTVLDEIHIVNFAIAKKYRRHKLGSHMLKYVETKAQEQGIVICLLEVSTRNEVAICMYEQLGYKKQSRRLKYYTDGSDAWLMSKEL